MNMWNQYYTRYRFFTNNFKIYIITVVLVCFRLYGSIMVVRSVRML